MKTCSVVFEDMPVIKGQCYSFFFFLLRRHQKRLQLEDTSAIIVPSSSALQETQTRNGKKEREIKMESVVVDVVRIKSAGRETKNEEWMQAI